MKHGAKSHSNTRKILNNNNVHTHTHARTHARTHAPTHPYIHSMQRKLHKWSTGVQHEAVLFTIPQSVFVHTVAKCSRS